MQSGHENWASKWYALFGEREFHGTFLSLTGLKVHTRGGCESRHAGSHILQAVYARGVVTHCIGEPCGTHCQTLASQQQTPKSDEQPLSSPGHAPENEGD